MVKFVEALVAALDEDGQAGQYEIASEHAHSCCVLAGMSLPVTFSCSNNPAQLLRDSRSTGHGRRGLM